MNRLENRKQRYVTLAEVESLKLPFRQGDIREDGFIFRQYYVRVNSDTGEESRISEQWQSEEAYKKQQSRKAIQKKRNAYSNKGFVRRVKSIFGCSVCGYKKSLLALHFHHVGPKVNEVSKMFGYSRKNIKKEMRNCILVCSNCHCEIHDKKNKDKE